MTTPAAPSAPALDSATYDLKKLARQRAAGAHQGITSICSAHPAVIEAVLVRELHSPGPVLIEATCNQVNQFGGYTGMTPADFRAYTLGIAAKVGFPDGRILFGGDHLGPNPWKSLPAEQALKNSEDLVAAFVDAGFTKIHIDTSMACAGDPTPLPDAVIAERAARLAKVAESRPNSAHLRYVIGTEVPTPGGALEHHTTLAVTSPADAERALALHRDAFARLGLEQVWDKVIALVVQPGVEFGDESIDDYAPEKARELSKLLDRHPGIVFEAHSTDYQRPRAFYELVRDGFPILKVGPAMTYAYRLAVFALESIEREIVPEAEWSRLAETAERVMLAHPENWQHHYHGSEATLRRLRVHSYSDRIRYYWNQPELEQAVAKLYENLGTAPLPETLVATYLPLQYARWREGKTALTAHALVLDSIHGMLEPYLEACAAR